MISSILTKLIELLMKKYLDEKSKRHRIAKLFTTLYFDLDKCNIAFKEYQLQPHSVNFVIWEDRVRALLSSFSKVNESLIIFDHELAALMYTYCEIESYFCECRQPVAVWNVLTRENTLGIGKTEEIDPDLLNSSINELLEKMRNFIKNNFTIEDII